MVAGSSPAGRAISSQELNHHIKRRDCRGDVHFALALASAGCHWVLANLLAYDRSFAEADAEFAKAIELDPNEADTWATLSDIAVFGRAGRGGP